MTSLIDIAILIIVVIVIIVLLKVLLGVLAIAPLGYEHEMSMIQTAIQTLRPT